MRLVPAALVRVWGSLREPRKVTATTVMAYVGVFVLGAVGLLSDSPYPAGSRVLYDVACLLAVVAGAIGAPAAWVGAWWIERAATIFGLGMTAAVTATAVARVLAQEPEWQVTYAVILGLPTVCSAALWAKRFLRVSGQVWAPGRGPVEVEELRELQARVAASAALAP